MSIWTEEEDNLLLNRSGAVKDCYIQDKSFKSKSSRATRLRKVYDINSDDRSYLKYIIEELGYTNKEAAAELDLDPRVIGIALHKFDIHINIIKNNDLYIRWLYKNRSNIKSMEEFEKSSIKIKHLFTDCGHISNITPNDIQQGKGCGICHNMNTETYNKWLENNRPNIKFMGIYTKSNVKGDHLFLECKHINNIAPVHIKRGKDCIICHDIAKTVYLLYFKELDLYKIGKTNEINRRIKEFGYKPEIIVLKDFDNPEDCTIFEKYLLNKYKSYLVNIRKLNSGNTETLKINNIDSLIKEYI